MKDDKSEQIFPNNTGNIPSITELQNVNQNNQRRQQQYQQYTGMDMGPGQFDAINVEMHYQEILTALNRIADNREINMVSFSIVLVVALFLGYMAIDFGFADGFKLRVPRDLFVMIIALFVLIIVLHKNDVFNLKSNKKKTT